MQAARAKADAAFEFFAKLGAPYYTFHDCDVAPERATGASRRVRPPTPTLPSSR